MKRDGCDLHIQAKGGEPVCSEAMEQRTDWSERPGFCVEEDRGRDTCEEAAGLILARPWGLEGRVKCERS